MEAINDITASSVKAAAVGDAVPGSGTRRMQIRRKNK